MEIHQVKILESARKLGIDVIDLSDEWRMDVLRLCWRGQSHLVIQGRIFPVLGHQADMIAAHKHAGKRFLAELGIPVPKGMVFKDFCGAENEMEQFLKAGTIAVCKPLDATEGEGVLMDVRDLRQVQAHWESLKDRFETFILEEQVPGEDLRIQSFRGKLVAACVREPASVVGDGFSTVRELIQVRAGEVAELNPENKLEIDQQTHELLEKAGLSLTSVPAVGRKLRVKKVANMSQGAAAVDVTDRIHPLYSQWVETIALALNLPLFALDVMTDDFQKNPSQHGAVLEINAQPAWIHHTFSSGRQHDIPTMILKDLFKMEA